VIRNINGHAGLTHKTLFSFPFASTASCGRCAFRQIFCGFYFSLPEQSFLLAKGQYILGSFF